jgi:hypothetical protein
MSRGKVDKLVNQSALANAIHNMNDDELDVFLASDSRHARRLLRAALRVRDDVPTIVCLCGSTRFYKQFQETYFNETMNGKIVLSVGFYPHSSVEAHGQEIGTTPEQKEKLDILHKCKVALSDEILVIDVDGYIGESTRSEIEVAEKFEKKIRYWSTEREK